MAELDTAAIRARHQREERGGEVVCRHSRLTTVTYCDALALLDALDEARRQLAALPAWTCPSCGAETRARMADHPAVAADLELQAELEHLEATDPAVAAAARSYDEMVERFTATNWQREEIEHQTARAETAESALGLILSVGFHDFEPTTGSGQCGRRFDHLPKAMACGAPREHPAHRVAAGGIPAPAAATDGRCPSCEHSWAHHSEPGCWFTVVTGRPGKDCVCACSLLPSTRCCGRGEFGEGHDCEKQDAALAGTDGALAAGGTTPTAPPAAERHEYEMADTKSIVMGHWRDGDSCVQCGRGPDHPVHQPATTSGDTEPAADERTKALFLAAALEDSRCPHGAPLYACNQPTTSGQAEHGIDTAGIREWARTGHWPEGTDMDETLLALCDALDQVQREADERWAERNERVLTLADEVERLAEERQQEALLRIGAEAAAEMFREERDEARARLDEIRALYGRDWHILAILDRPATASTAESCAGCGHAPGEHPIHCDAYLDAVPEEFPGPPAAQGTAKPARNSGARLPYRRRLQGCVDAWSDAEDGAYHPSCCRFPKVCSPHPHPGEDQALGPALEPMPPWGRDPDEDPR